jgi:hypothetical protein
LLFYFVQDKNNPGIQPSNNSDHQKEGQSLYCDVSFNSS